MKFLIAFLTLSISAFSQVAGTANEGYKTKEGRDRVAKTLSDPARDKTQQPEVVVAALDLKPGMTVADIGTGVGYLLPHLSKAVGPAGKVLAEDIQQDFLDTARGRIAENKLSNVTLVLGTETDPKLPAGAVDVALILDVYHHFDFPGKMLAAIKSALKPNGRLVIDEYYQSEVAPGHIRLGPEGVVKEIEANGFKLASKNDHITSRQYSLTFVKN